MQKAISVFMLGVFLDLITTILGVTVGFTESNVLGLNFVILANVVIFLIAYIFRNAEINKSIVILLFIMGFLKILIAINNLRLIIRVI